ncbi:hypothetical protein [Streptomyces mayteni]
MTTAAATALHRVPVVLYVATCVDHAPQPILEFCRSYAQARPWRVAAELTDAIADPLLPTTRRPGWRQLRELVVGGWAHGVLTYAGPMIAIGRDAYTDMELWAQHRACFLATAWTPHEGDVVRDTARGRTGVCMKYDARGTRVWLRPEGGGREWTAPTTALEPGVLPIATDA